MRDVIVADWLAASDWAGWNRTAIAGDASARSYDRLTHNGVSVILMNAPPETCGSQAPFVQIAQHLSALGLAAPAIYAWDEPLGLLILEDLGRHDIANVLATKPSDEPTLYTAAVDVLSVVQNAPPPAGLTQMTPNVGADMIGLAFEWAARDESADLKAEIQTALKTLLTEVAPTPSVLSLRDYHAQNLIWRPNRTGTDRIGLLDFQDAFVTHPTYDLVSLLRDARRDVSPDLTDPLMEQLIPNPASHEAAHHAFHVIAIQRNLRILGIFHRLAEQDSKDGYLALLPRVIGHLRTDLAAPVAAGIAPLIYRAFDLGGPS